MPPPCWTCRCSGFGPGPVAAFAPARLPGKTWTRLCLPCPSRRRRCTSPAPIIWGGCSPLGSWLRCATGTGPSCWWTMLTEPISTSCQSPATPWIWVQTSAATRPTKRCRSSLGGLSAHFPPGAPGGSLPGQKCHGYVRFYQSLLPHPRLSGPVQRLSGGQLPGAAPPDPGAAPRLPSPAAGLGVAPPPTPTPSPDPPYRPVRLLRQGDCPASAAESGGMRICQPGRAGADGHTGKPASGPGAGLAGPGPCPSWAPSPIGSRTVWGVQYPGDDSAGGPLFSTGNHSCRSSFGQDLRRSHRGLPPAIPITVSGERFTPEALALFRHYGITAVDAVIESPSCCIT